MRKAHRIYKNKTIYLCLSFAMKIDYISLYTSDHDKHLYYKLQRSCLSKQAPSITHSTAEKISYKSN